MPEGPEVAITAQLIEKSFKGFKLIDVKFLKGIYTKNEPKGFSSFLELLPLTLEKVSSVGKFMWFEFDNDNPVHVWNTFGLTGGWSNDYDESYSRALFRFVDSKNNQLDLYFIDPIGFGKFNFPSNILETKNKINELKPDLLKDDFDLSNIKKFKQPIVKILMDQKKIGSGIGNYLSAEILYRAKLSPHKKGNEMTTKEIRNLEYWIKYTMKLAYLNNNTGYMYYLPHKNIKKINYHPDIDIGNTKFDFLIYKKSKDPEGHDVIPDKIIPSRTTYWVPDVQK